MTENVVYEDKVKSSPVVVAVLALSFFIVLIVGVFLYYQQKDSLSINTFVPLSLVLVLDLFVLIVFSQMQVTITDKNLRFGFSIFKKKVSLNQIESVEIDEFKFSDYLGYGIRYGRNNTVGYVPCGGQGIKIKIKNDKRFFFFISNKPEEALALIKQYGHQK